MPADPISEDLERRLFDEALDLPVGAERDAWLAGACRGDQSLKLRIQALLRVQAEETHFLPESLPTVITPPSEQPGERIGRYKLLQQIGEGGFGSVWMAEQMDPVSRRVALKIIKLGMDTREVIARFEAERQALAMMEHPNIAKVFEAGATDRGRPFFVMELVKGMPITTYCDEAGMGTRERLALFGDVCSAINHAHQKGIIHRDIKPSNVMVTLHGDQPVVKVIDFGIAKATQGKLTDKTIFTRFEQFIGTPVYMSPAGEPERAGRGHPQQHLRAGDPALRTARRQTALRRKITGLGGLRGNAAHHPRSRAGETVVTSEHRRRRRAHAAGEVAPHRTGETAPPRRARPRLDRDKGHRKGPHAALRDGQCLRAGHRALPFRPAGHRHATERGLPVPEVRPAQQSRAARGLDHRRRARRSDGGEPVEDAGRRGTHHRSQTPPHRAGETHRHAERRHRLDRDEVP